MHVFTGCLVISIMSTLKFLVHVSMLIKNPGGKQGVFSHEILETHKTMQSLLDVDKQNQYKTSQSIHLLKTPNFLKSHNSCCVQRP